MKTASAMLNLTCIYIQLCHPFTHFALRCYRSHTFKSCYIIDYIYWLFWFSIRIKDEVRCIITTWCQQDDVTLCRTLYHVHTLTLKHVGSCIITLLTPAGNTAPAHNTHKTITKAQSPERENNLYSSLNLKPVTCDRVSIVRGAFWDVYLWGSASQQ